MVRLDPIAKARFRTRVAVISTGDMEAESARRRILERI
jgi:hypothetical protein